MARPIKPNVQPMPTGQSVEWTDCVTGLNHVYTAFEEDNQRPSSNKDSWYCLNFGENMYWFATNSELVRWCIDSGFPTLAVERDGLPGGYITRTWDGIK
jgi:hypothetical protein